MLKITAVCRKCECVDVCLLPLSYARYIKYDFNSGLIMTSFNRFDFVRMVTKCEVCGSVEFYKPHKKVIIVKVNKNGKN